MAQENCTRCGDFFAPVAALNDANPGLCQECYGYYDQAWLARVNKGFKIWIGGLTTWAVGLGLLIDNHFLDGFVRWLRTQKTLDFRSMALIVFLGPPLIFTIYCIFQWRRAQREHEKINKGPMKRRWLLIIAKRLIIATVVSAFVLSGWLMPAIQPFYQTRTAFNIGWFGVFVLGCWLLRSVRFERLNK